MNLLDGFVFQSECIGFYLAKLIGYAILVGSVALKLPQILNIVLTKNAEGLSEIAFYIEVPMCITTVIYNIRKGNAFSSYGETFVILIQNIILVLLLWIYMKPSPSMKTKVAVVVGCLSVAYSCYAMKPETEFIIPLTNLPMMIWSRMMQIVYNMKRESTGQLSMITTFLIFGGSLARVFTTVQEVGWDYALLTGFGTSSFLSGVLMAQVQIRTHCFVHVHALIDTITQIVYYSYVKPKPVTAAGKDAAATENTEPKKSKKDKKSE